MGSLRLMWRYSGWVLFYATLLGWAIFWHVIYEEEPVEPASTCITGSIRTIAMPGAPGPAKACVYPDGRITIVNPMNPVQGLVFEPSVPGPLY